MTPPKLYLIRHGETEWSLTGQHTGRTDIPLTTSGERAARDLQRRLQSVAFSIVLTSPRLRARHTCELAGLGAIARIEPLLAEWDYGDFEGLRSPEIHRLAPGWNVFDDGGSNGELPDQVAERADRLIEQLAGHEGNIALFTHGHFGRTLAMRWIGQSVSLAKHFILGTAAICILTIDSHHPDVRVIERWNGVD